jgi:hypothetical protein
VSGNKRVTKQPILTVCSGLSDVKDNSFFDTANIIEVYLNIKIHYFCIEDKQGYLKALLCLDGTGH